MFFSQNSSFSGINLLSKDCFQHGIESVVLFVFTEIKQNREIKIITILKVVIERDLLASFEFIFYCACA